MTDKDRSKSDEEEREGAAEAEEKCEGCGRKGRRLPFFRPRKSKKLRKQKAIYVNSRGGGGWCCLCVGQPKTLDSSGESPTTSDPNSSEFNFDMLKALIEKNDFYSKECNPHLDGNDRSPNHRI